MPHLHIHMHVNYTLTTPTDLEVALSRELHDISWLSRLYALLYLSSPELIKRLHFEFPKQAIVAANITTASDADKYVAAITSASKTKYEFSLDLQSKTHQSKGNWIWITQLEIYCAEYQILSFTIKKRVIDIPYHGESISAYWLLKNFYPELLDFLNNKLQVKISGAKKFK